MQEAADRKSDTNDPDADKFLNRVNPKEYSEDHQIMEDEIAMLKEAMQKLEGPDKQKIADAVNEASINIDNKRSNIDPRNIRSDKRLRSKTQILVEDTNEKIRKASDGKLPRKIYQCPIGTRVRIKSKELGEAYCASTKNKYAVGTIKSRAPQGTLNILFDDDAENGKNNTVRCRWDLLEHLPDANLVPVFVSPLNVSREMHYSQLCESLGIPITSHPFCLLASLEDNLTRRTKYESSHDDLKYPKSFWEVLLLDDWKSWIEAIRKEMKCWIENGTFEYADIKDVPPGAPIIDLGELYLIKRSGKYKYRQYARGDQQKEGTYFKTTTKTVNSEIVRFIASLSVGTGRKMKGGDVITAYLLSEQRTPLFAWPASHMEYLFADDDVLSSLRRKIKDEVKRNGVKMIRDLNRKNRHKQNKVLRLKKAVYGAMDAGDSFQLLKEWAFDQAGAKRLFTDSAVYYFQEPRIPEICDNGVCNDKWFILFSHTDDFGYFGCDDEYEEECKARIDKYLKMEWSELDDYTSVQFTQDVDLGLCEMNMPKYWEQLAIEFKIDVDKCKVFVPLPVNCKFEESTPEKHQAAIDKDLKYLELVGSLIYPACVCKLEIKYAVSLLGSHMHNYTEQHYNYAIHVLKYGITTRHMGLIYSRGLDPHGLNEVYGYADSNFQAPRSTGGHTLMNNGAAFINTAKKHPTVDTSSTMAELSELFYCTLNVSIIRNFMDEIGLRITEPTLVYQDNQPCIKIVNNFKTATLNTAKTMDIRTSRVKEMIHDEQALRVEWLETTKLISDLNTKNLPRDQFEKLRNVMNGYALVMEKHPQWFEDRKSISHVNWTNNPTKSKALGKRKSEDEVTNFFEYLQ